MIPKHKIKKNPRDYVASKSRNIVVAWKVAENRGFSEDYIVWREKMGGVVDRGNEKNTNFARQIFDLI